MHSAAVVARSVGCQCDTEMPTLLLVNGALLAYFDTKDDLEIYKWKKTKTLEEMTMRVHRSELRFYPFSLTNKNEIPVKIVKELVTDGYAVMLISTVN